MNEHQLFQDAKRWPGKSAAASETADFLAEHLERMSSHLNAAESKYNAGAYGESYAKLADAKDIADAVKETSGWAASGYDYRARMYDESYPALQQLLALVEEAAELENAGR